MTNPAVATPPPSTPSLDLLFGSLWPERDVPARPRLVGAALAVGLLAAMVLPFRDLGIGTFAVVVAVGVPALLTRWATRTPYLLVSAGLATLLLSTVALRDAEWIAVLCMLAAFGVAVSGLVDARTVTGVLASACAVPLACLRGLPWLGRSVRGASHLGSWWPVLRTATVSLLLVMVFAALFASADALFASWLDVIVPDLTVDTFVLRVFVLLAVAGLALAASYVALNAPRVEVLAPTSIRPVKREFEWVVPVGLVLALYVGFVAAQLTVMFGGHDYLRATTGLTYAEYVHEGFGQLTVATLLTLGVVAVAARKAPRATGRDRLLLRGVLGALCMLTLVVVASALFRMHVYEEAYGFTQLRLLVSVFEGWLGLVVLLVMAAGIRMNGHWVPRAAVVTAGVAMLGLAVLNPDAYVAERNVERYAATGKADWYYLASLSADAVPALEGLPSDAQRCVFGTPAASTGDWLEWNLGRARAGDRTLDASAGCVAR
ncbi:MAG: DUF4153 domain-containing protein [Nocardioides sp.]